MMVDPRKVSKPDKDRPYLLIDVTISTILLYFLYCIVS
jgi:hypothetical protein